MEKQIALTFMQESCPCTSLRQAIDGKEEEFAFTLEQRQSRRVPAKMLADLDFTDDIVLLSNDIREAQAL